MRIFSMKQAVPVALAAVLAFLPVLPALADSTYSFTEDFAYTYNLNMLQTSAKLFQGRVQTADNSNSSQVVSGVVATAIRNIRNARLETADNRPGGTQIVYWVSNNNGAYYQPVAPGGTIEFSTFGNQLVWKAILARDNVAIPSATIDTITFYYTVSDTIAVNGNEYNPSGTAISFGGSDLNSFVCNVLARVGLACGSVAPTPYVGSDYHARSGGLNFDVLGGGSKGSNVSNPVLTAAIASAGVKDLAGRSIMLVKVPGRSDIYEILNGRKHAFPTMGIFYDYGYILEMVETIPQSQLDKYPRAYLLRVHGDRKKTYYLTEGGLIRIIPNDKKVFDSYGDREEDIIEISQKEFNYYPVNQFVFLENPLNRDVFQVTAEGKRYLTPMALARLHVRDEQIAPINKIQFDWYKTLAPVVN